ncbi:hypothetical protein [Saccharothrix hoggarensis]|uniref:Tetratricopeptide repeat protein n=1 Tax=Saccharothrix hoggarensis TaxID=913853 RepID=A0ABW3QVY2_9PSEU
MTLFRELGDPYREATSLDRLGDALEATGDRPGAGAWTRALAVLEPLDHPDTIEIQAKLLHTGTRRHDRCHE